MQYSFLSAAILALSSVVSAQTPFFDSITAPTQDQSVAAGTTLNIVWEPTNFTGPTDTVTITLLQGATVGTLSLGAVIKANILNSVGTFAWSIPTSLEYFPTYGFEISYDANTAIFQYSFPFHVTGLATSSASGSGTPTTVTMHLSTGSAYITSTSSIASNTTTLASSTLYANSTSTTASTTSTVTPYSNFTVVSTTITTQAAQTSAIVSQTPTTIAAPIPSTGAAVANVARGSFAILGGLLVAFAL